MAGIPGLLASSRCALGLPHQRAGFASHHLPVSLDVARLTGMVLKMMALNSDSPRCWFSTGTVMARPRIAAFCFACLLIACPLAIFTWQRLASHAQLCRHNTGRQNQHNLSTLLATSLVSETVITCQLCWQRHSLELRLCLA